MVKTQAPGYYRIMVGDFEVTALSDGTAQAPLGQFLNEKPELVERALAHDFLKDPVELSVNAFLINTGAKLVLVDTGDAGGMQGTGKLLENLKAAGYDPAQVDEVYITHMHGDHISGLTAKRRARISQCGGAGGAPGCRLLAQRRQAGRRTRRCQTGDAGGTGHVRTLPQGRQVQALRR